MFSRLVAEYVICLYACAWEFHHTVEIIARILRKVVTRVRLCDHRPRRGYTVKCMCRERKREGEGEEERERESV